MGWFAWCYFYKIMYTCAIEITVQIFSFWLLSSAFIAFQISQSLPLIDFWLYRVEYFFTHNLYVVTPVYKVFSSCQIDILTNEI